MKVLLVLALLLSRAASAAISFVAGSENSGCTTTPTNTLAISLFVAYTTGNDVVVAVAGDSTTVNFSVSDDGGNTYVKQATATNTTNGAIRAVLFEARSVSSTATTVTISSGLAVVTICGTVAEYSGVGSLGGTTVNSGNNSHAGGIDSTVSLTTTANNSFVVAAHGVKSGTSACLIPPCWSAVTGNLRQGIDTGSSVTAAAGSDNTAVSPSSVTNDMFYSAANLSTIGFAAAALELIPSGGGGGGAQVFGAPGPTAEPSRVFVVPRGTLSVSTFSIDYLLNQPVRLDAPHGVQVCQQLNPQGGLVGTTTIRCIGGSTP